jgi:hypothetical protein
MKKVVGVMLAIGVVLSSVSVFASDVKPLVNCYYDPVTKSYHCKPLPKPPIKPQPIKPKPINPKPINPQPIPAPIKPHPIESPPVEQMP